MLLALLLLLGVPQRLDQAQSAAEARRQPGM
jgi:hypothetical protein